MRILYVCQDCDEIFDEWELTKEDLEYLEELGISFLTGLGDYDIMAVDLKNEPLMVPAYCGECRNLRGVDDSEVDWYSTPKLH